MACAAACSGYAETEVYDPREVQALVESTMRAIDESIEQFQAVNSGPFQGKSVVIIGNTGVGKSTLINLIANIILQAKYDDELGRSFIDTEHPLEGFRLGHRLTSETSIPRRWIDPETAIGYWDCPGFDDNRGPAQEIANARTIQKIFEVSTHVKLVLMVDEHTLMETRIVALKTLTSLLGTFLGNNDALRESISLVVSNAAPNRTASHIKKVFEKILSERSSAQSPSLCRNERHLLEILGSRPIVIFKKPNQDGSDFNQNAIRHEILDTLSRIPYAENAKVNFSLSFKGNVVALESYNRLGGYITRKIRDIMGVLKAGIEALATPYYNPQTQVAEAERLLAQVRLTKIKVSLEEIENHPYALSEVGHMVSQCALIVEQCGRRIFPDEIADFVRKNQHIDFLKQLINTSAYMPLEIVRSVREAVIACRIVIHKALITLTAIDATEKAQRETQRASEEVKRAEEERKRAEAAEQRFREAEAARQAAEAARRAAEQASRDSGKNSCTIL